MSSESDKEGREFTRVPIKVDAKVIAGKEMILSQGTRDVSMKGMFLSCSQTLPVGTECDITLFLGGIESGTQITVKGQIERCLAGGMAVQFTEIGLDSYPHLQNLVLYNSQNTHKVEQEIKDHLGLKKRD